MRIPPNKLPPKIDCFAWDDERKECSALNRTYCRKYENCAFYKTFRQNEFEKKKAQRRLGLEKTTTK